MFKPSVALNLAFVNMVALLAISCQESELKSTFKALDTEIEHIEQYADAVDRKAFELKVAALCAPSDSVRWERIHKLVNIYGSFNLDSMSRYVSIEKAYAATKLQMLYTQFDDIYELAFRGDGMRASKAYASIDASSFSDEVFDDYLRLGLNIFKHDNNPPAYFEDIRLQLLSRDSTSFLGIENKARFLKMEEKFGQAEKLFLDYIEANPDGENESAALYNLATIYGRLGDREKMELYMAKSAISDIRHGRKVFLSLYKLATYLLEDRDYERASRYINVHFKVISDGYFYPRAMMSGSAASTISEQYIHSQKRLHTIITGAGVAFLLFCLVTLLQLRRNKENSRRLEQMNGNLLDTQEKLTVTSKIKESYVSRYMILARRYLAQTAQLRLEYKRTLMEEGPEELFKKLKQVDREYVSETEFYRIFDETFLGIFPDFIHQVNSLLRPECAFDENTSTLPTEIRILAVIRLGITASADIATFLNCSLNTVYTYRGKIRNAALVPKDEVESKISELGY